MKRRIVALTLCLMMAVTAIGCGESESGESVAATETEAITEETTETELPELVYTSRGFDINADDYVTLCDYSAVPVTITGDYTVEDSDVTDYLEQMFSYYGPFYQVDDTKTVVSEGDIVNVDYVGTLDGVAFDGGSATDQNLDVYNNASVTGTTFIDGFTDGLKGASVGDTIDSNVTFPDDYSATDLAGKEVVFTFTVNSIQKEITIDDIDDDFAKENFQADSVEAMNTDIRSYLESYAESNRSNDIYTGMEAYLVENCTVEVPQDYLDARINDYKNQMIEQNCGGDPSQFESFLSTNYGYTEDQFYTEVSDGMTENIKLELIMEAIAKAEGLTLDEEGYATYISDLVSNNSYESEEALYQAYGYGNAADGEKYLRQIYVDNQALELVYGTAVVTEEPATEEAAEAVDAETTETAE